MENKNSLSRIEYITTILSQFCASHQYCSSYYQEFFLWEQKISLNRSINYCRSIYCKMRKYHLLVLIKKKAESGSVSEYQSSTITYKLRVDTILALFSRAQPIINGNNSSLLSKERDLMRFRISQERPEVANVGRNHSRLENAIMAQLHLKTIQYEKEALRSKVGLC